MELSPRSPAWPRGEEPFELVLIQGAHLIFTDTHTDYMLKTIDKVIFPSPPHPKEVLKSWLLGFTAAMVIARL